MQDGLTALMRAARRGRTAIFEMLLKKGADVDLQNIVSEMDILAYLLIFISLFANYFVLELI